MYIKYYYLTQNIIANTAVTVQKDVSNCIPQFNIHVGIRIILSCTIKLVCEHDAQQKLEKFLLVCDHFAV